MTITPNNFNTEAEFISFWDTEFDSQLPLGSSGPGGSTFIIRDNTDVWSEGFGKASVAHGTDFTPQTPSGIRSVTKSLTGALVLLAEEESWFNPGGAPISYGIIYKPLSAFPVIADNIYRWEDRFIPDADRFIGGSARPIHLNATVRDIVAHQSGHWISDWYVDGTTGLRRPNYGPFNRYWEAPVGNPNKWDGYESFDNLIALKNWMETLESIDDIVAMFGATHNGMDPAQYLPTLQPNEPLYTPNLFTNRAGTAVYIDKVGWLSGAVCEYMLGNSWYNLIQERFFDAMSLSNSYPSADGNAMFWWDVYDMDDNPTGVDGWRAIFQGHNSNPMEIPGLATAYRAGPATTRNPDGLYLEPEQAQESGYAIGCGVMSTEDLARWGRNLIRPPGETDAVFQFAPHIDRMFNTSPGCETDCTDISPTAGDAWPGRNWAFGTQKLEPVTAGSGTGGANNDGELDVFGGIGFGGAAGYGAAIVWIREHNMVFAANTNSLSYGNLASKDPAFTGGGGVDQKNAYRMAVDYAHNFL